MNGAVISSPDYVRFGEGFPTPPDTLEWQLIEGDTTAFPEITAEWSALCDSQSGATEYLRPALIRAYLDSFAPGAPLMLMLARRNRDLEVVLPLTRRTIGRGHHGLHWLHGAGNIQFPVFDAICDERRGRDHAQGLWDALHSLRRWDVLQFDAVPEGGVLDRMRALAERDGVSVYIHRPEDTPVYPIGPAESMVDVVAQQRRSLRQQLRRNLKRLESIGDIGFVDAGWDDDHALLTRTFDCFMEMEHRSWKGRQGTSVKAKTATKSYYERLFRDPEVRDRFRAHLLTLNGEPFASSIGMVSGSTFYGLKNAHDETFRTYAPGHLLMLFMIHGLGRRGIRYLDLGGDANQYKRAWTSETRRQATVFLFRPGVRGFLAHALLLDVGYRIKRFLGDRPLPSIARRFVD